MCFVGLGDACRYERFNAHIPSLVCGDLVLQVVALLNQWFHTRRQKNFKVWLIKSNRFLWPIYFYYILNWLDQ